MNSLIIALVIASGKIVISILSAYAIVFFQFPFRLLAFWIIFIASLMLPVEVRIMPTLKVVADHRAAQLLCRAHHPADRLGNSDLPLPTVLPHCPRRTNGGGPGRWRRSDEVLPRHPPAS